MLALKVSIDRYIDDSFPGVVECRLVDVAGRTHLFQEKLPVVTLASLSAESRYPCDGEIRCTVLESGANADGREVLIVSTEQPDGVESTQGNSRFEVFSHQLTRLDG